MARSSRAIASRRLQHSMLPSGAVLRQLGWGEQLQCADGTWCARLARSRRAGGGIRCCRAALSSAGSAGSATAERGRRVASLTRSIATRRRQHPMLPCGVALCPHIWGGCVQSLYGTWRARLTRSRRAGFCTQRIRAALPSASSAGEGACRAQLARGVIISHDRDMPAVALGAALRRCPLPVLLGRATAESGRHMVCSSRVIATRRRSTCCCRAALPSASSAGECSSRALTALGVLVSRDSDAPAAASEASVRRCTLQAQPGRAPAERRRHVACLSRATAKRRLRHLTQPCGTALRQLGWERDCRARTTQRVLVSRDRDAPAVALGAAVQCCPPGVTSTAGEDDCRARTTRGVLVSRDREAPAAASDAAMLHCPPPARLGRATAEH